ncbi:MAG: hypothetical protein C0490_22855 [Marivirga sp.]|nr:hypothetical protein [Marivirga sp.]
MNNLKTIGLSARRKTIKIPSHHSPLLIFLIGALLILSSCHEKSKGQHAAELIKSQVADTLGKPKVNIKVNRHYDDKGNVVGFDSTYTSYYSNVSGDTAQMDSLMNRFDRYFNLNHSSFFRNEFSPLFFNDSLRYPDFFHDDFFRKRYELNDEYLKGMMQRMDSIKNRFYRDESVKSKKSSDL